MVGQLQNVSAEGMQKPLSGNGKVKKMLLSKTELEQT